MARDVRTTAASLFIAVATCIGIALPQHANAWGALGHRLICAVALMQLDTGQRDEIDRLASTFRDPDGRGRRYFTSGCVFADRARGRARDGASSWRAFARFRRWHFINVPRHAAGVRSRHCGDDCVLTGIEHHLRRFADHDRSDAARATAMLMMSHWIADAHQPMHVGFADDFGGNDVDVTGGYYSQRNLHAVWDDGVVKHMLGDHDWWDYAKSLNDSVSGRQRAQWLAKTPLDWVSESFAISVDPRTRYCRMDGSTCRAIPGARRLGRSFQRYAADVVRRRILQAGVRLAALLSKGLRP